MMLLWKLAYKFVCGHMVSVIMGTCLGVELLCHMVTSTLWGAAGLCFIAVASFYVALGNVGGFKFLHILVYTCYSKLFFVLFFLSAPQFGWSLLTYIPSLLFLLPVQIFNLKIPVWLLFIITSPLLIFSIWWDMVLILLDPYVWFPLMLWIWF